jgi:hypothetical protein
VATITAAGYTRLSDDELKVRFESIAEQVKPK